MIAHVTVGIPFLNARATLLDSIRSVFAQSFADWNLLVVDDGSTDGSVEIARSVRDPRVTVLVDGAHRGLVYRLNQLVARTQSPYFARMDADDLMHPERLARQMAEFARRPEVEILGSAAYVIDQSGKPYGVRGDSPAYVAKTDVRAGFLHPTVIARTDWMRRHPYDPAFTRAEDLELWRRADAATVCARLPEPLLFYREPLTSALSKYRASCRSERKAIRQRPWRNSFFASGAPAIAAVYAKECIYAALSPTPFVRALIRRRNRPCTPLELGAAAAALARISRVRLTEFA